MKSPLNFIFGQGESAVRILRLLSNFPENYLGIPEISKNTGLSNAGTRRTLGALEKSGILISPLSTKKSYAIRASHPLALVITKLFHDEKVLFDTVKGAVLTAFGGEQGYTSSLWLDADYYEPGKSLEVHFVAYNDRIFEIVQAASESIADLERKIDLTVDIIPHERDSLIVSPKNFCLLSGLPPETFSSNRKPFKKAPRTNDEQKQAALIKAEKIAQMIEKDPKLIMEAQQKLSLHIENASPSIKEQLL